MPPEEAVRHERLIVVSSRVEHHLDDALDVPVRGLQRAHVHAEPPGNRRPDLLGFQSLSLDLAALQNVSGQGLENGFLLELDPK